MVRKIYSGGFTKQDYKDWGKEGGRPRKFKNEAEKKRFYRQQKALAEGRELRGYRLGRARKLIGDKSLDILSDVRCPKCNILLKTAQMIYNSRITWEWKEQTGIEPQLIPSCKNCGYQFSTRKTFHVALTDLERKDRSQLKKDVEEDEEDEEDD